MEKLLVLMLSIRFFTFEFPNIVPPPPNTVQELSLYAEISQAKMYKTGDTNRNLPVRIRMCFQFICQVLIAMSAMCKLNISVFKFQSKNYLNLAYNLILI